MNKVLFLGYDEKQNRIIPALRKNRKLIVDHKNEFVSLNQIELYDLVVCYGY